MQGLKCWNCGASLDGVVTGEPSRPISRHTNCQKCFEVLHCCRMCRWYAPGRPQDCDHDRAEPPVEKESANFCEYFSPSRTAFDREEASGKNAAQSKAAALFGDVEETEDSDDPDSDKPADKADDARSKLDDLFDD